jgi:hypothetical protein
MARFYCKNKFCMYFCTILKVVTLRNFKIKTWKFFNNNFCNSRPCTLNLHFLDIMPRLLLQSYLCFLF